MLLSFHSGVLLRLAAAYPVSRAHWVLTMREGSPSVNPIDVTKEPNEEISHLTWLDDWNEVRHEIRVWCGLLQLGSSPLRSPCPPRETQVSDY